MRKWRLCWEFFAILILFTGSAFAQELGTVEARGGFGVAAFLDEDEEHSAAFGTGVRFYLTPRISVEPEFYYMRGSDQTVGEGRVRDYEFNVHGAFDFLKTARVTPYVFGGGGFQLHRNEFRSPPMIFRIRETRESFGGGLGLKVFATDHVFITPEVRFGLETLTRVTVSVGYRF